MEKYDVVIIGGGIGGLACGAMLSKEGMSVRILEQNSAIGGCLQSFRRNGRNLDPGMHYVGSLSNGQIMHQYFKYFGIIDRLHLRKLDVDGFDVFHFGNGTEYRHAMEYDNFIETLARQFPEEREGLKSFCKTLKSIGDLISPEILREGKISNGGIEYMAMSAFDEINRHIGNETLRRVLAGNTSLYAGCKETTSMYEYGMIMHSNIQGAYTFEDGAQHVADALAAAIEANGGEVSTSAKVSKIRLNGTVAEYAELENGEKIFGTHIISSLHPSVTFALTDNNTVYKKAFFTRIDSLKNTYGIFATYLLTKPNSVRYVNRNNYLFNNPDVWAVDGNYRGFDIPSTLMCMQANAGSEYTDVVTLLTPMPISRCAKWLDTETGRRGEDYKEFKSQFSEAVTEFVCSYFPSLRNCIDKVYTASPLTYRDYTATPDGSAYGMVKDYHNPMITHIPAKTRIRNLLLTGQNLNIHGCIGTTISATVTCSEILGTEYLAKKIGDA